MKLFKKLTTYFAAITLVLSGSSIRSIASEGEEGSEAFDDPNSEESTEESDSSSSDSCLLYTSPSPRDVEESRMPSSA